MRSLSYGKLGYDCRRVSTNCPTQLNSTQRVQFSIFSTESVGSRRELVANSIHTPLNADATQLVLSSRVGGVSWALASVVVLYITF